MSYAFGDWGDATPSNMRTWPEDKLVACMDYDGGGQYATRARAEIARRQNEQIKDLLSEVSAVTDRVRGETAKLTSSSQKMEDLTNTLKNLTWALIVLTIAAVAVPIGIEVWKASHESHIALPASPPEPKE